MIKCVFCEIIKGIEHAHIFKEDDYCLAIIPKKIEVDGHLLIIPKIHHQGIQDIPYDIICKVIMFTKDVCKELEENNKFKGFNILNASGVAAQQSVQHFHLHILPRNLNDGIDAWPILNGGKNIY